MTTRPTTPATKTAMVVLGTRPEAIKLAPVVHALRRQAPRLRTVLCLTGQHRELVRDLLAPLQLVPDHDLDLMAPRQSINDVAARLLTALPPVLAAERPDVVLVQGDTVSATAAGLAAFYAGIPVGHVEAGLRTGSLAEPFPEEGNRRLLSAISTVHYAPTKWAAGNLHRENIPDADVIVTGNTGIDSFRAMAARGAATPPPHLRALVGEAEQRGDRIVLVTVHRRENQTAELPRICEAIARVADEPGTHIVFPMHPSPAVRSVVQARLSGHPSISLLEPLDYPAIVWLLGRCRLVLTDSGGLQEESAAAGRPVLVLRKATDRPEGVQRGCAVLVGSDVEQIVRRARRLVHDDDHHTKVSAGTEIYGDGHAAERIAVSVMDLVGAGAPVSLVKNRPQSAVGSAPAPVVVQRAATRTGVAD